MEMVARSQIHWPTEVGMFFQKNGPIRETLRTVSLPRLIELKLVTWRFKDFGDVVESIRRNNLTETLTDRLDPAVRTAYLDCWDQARDENYDGLQA